ncbi:MAG: GNAT family N-acetyltransferase [Ignavibacteria bacterium]|nr:GNAT family N-acetyltransferase [Ignavibacteria bacterium]
MLDLYSDAGWTLYTNDPGLLKEAIAGSHYVVQARDEGKLIGLVRCISDGRTIAYVQDLLVLNSYKRKGIGTVMMRMVMQRYGSVRQLVLLTDDTPELCEFYESLGLAEAKNMKLAAFVRIKN